MNPAPVKDEKIKITFCWVVPFCRRSLLECQNHKRQLPVPADYPDRRFLKLNIGPSGKFGKNWPTVVALIGGKRCSMSYPPHHPRIIQ